MNLSEIIYALGHKGRLPPRLRVESSAHEQNSTFAGKDRSGIIDFDTRGMFNPRLSVEEHGNLVLNKRLAERVGEILNSAALVAAGLNVSYTPRQPTLQELQALNLMECYGMQRPGNEVVAAADASLRDFLVKGQITGERINRGGAALVHALVINEGKRAVRPTLPLGAERVELGQGSQIRNWWSANGLQEVGDPVMQFDGNGQLDIEHFQVEMELVESNPAVRSLWREANSDQKQRWIDEEMKRRRVATEGAGKETRLKARQQRSTWAVDRAAALGKGTAGVVGRIGGSVKNISFNQQREIRVSPLSSLQEQQTAQVAANRGVSYGEAEQAFKIAQLRQQAQANLQQAEAMETGSGITEERIPAEGISGFLGKLLNVR